MPYDPKTDYKKEFKESPPDARSYTTFDNNFSTNVLGQKVFTQFDFYLARRFDVEDANGTVYSDFYNDVFESAHKTDQSRQ